MPSRRRQRCDAYYWLCFIYFHSIIGVVFQLINQLNHQNIVQLIGHTRRKSIWLCVFVLGVSVKCSHSHGRMLTYLFFSLFSSLEAASHDGWMGHTGSDWMRKEKQSETFQIKNPYPNTLFQEYTSSCGVHPSLLLFTTDVLIVSLKAMQ